MIKIKFIGDNTRYIGEANTYDEAYRIMAKFIKDAEKTNGFHWYYTRVIFIDEEMKIHFDVGSHSEFFDFEFKDPYHYKDVCKRLFNSKKVSNG